MSTMNVNKAKSLFDIKKEKILRLLAVPFESYTDQSPKGSIDVGIRPLIDNINQLEGIVTTSSCAGRISVYLEGSKATKHKLDDDSNEAQSQSNQRGVPGGKGRGGRWLFVSHDPVHVPERRGLEDKPLSRLLGLSHRKEDFEYGAGQARYVRFQFEPMILHIMAASLHHAQPILSAAINAGFRESGLQSLKNLDDPSSCPMVAVRTSGLSLESLIGVLPEGENDSEIRCIVDEKYLVLLMNIANQRFVMNTERIQRFSENLFQRSKGVEPAWEDDLSRQKRKRAEGLKRKEALQKEIARENIKDSRVPEDHIYSAYD